MTQEEYNEKLDILEDLAMNREVAVYTFPKENWLEEFRTFFRIRDNIKTVPEVSEFSFEELMSGFTGGKDTEQILSLARELFGEPGALYQIRDDEKLRDRLGGPRGSCGFFFVFDLFFAVCDTCTVCWISGTNN